ncbi:MAG: MFS transporter [Alphaproteobacteria bacterium]|nr:MFS transporter [Alphaproteobacteria bacterium]
MARTALGELTAKQRHIVTAAYLGWTLDAFDFFLLVFVLTDVADAFGVSRLAVTWALTLTLAFRPVGAFAFGRLADRYGRKPVMMADVLLYAVFGFATAFAPNFSIFLVIRGCFGIAMGGEWGVAASLTMEAIPPRSRGIVSGLLQAGYPSGLLLASAVYGLLFPYIGWRGMFMVGLAPALLVLYIRRQVDESPGWHAETAMRAPGTLAVIRKHWKLALVTMAFMMAMNFFSHGTQDLYPTFLKVERGLGVHGIGTINMAAAVGAILGGIAFGALSQRIGRSNGLVLGALLAIPLVPFWVLAPSAGLLAVAAFFMQFVVQGCWGIIPAHLNELSPPEARGTFPGVVYQLGNFLASYNVTLQAGLAAACGSYALSLSAVAVAAAVMIGAIAYLSEDATHAELGSGIPGGGPQENRKSCGGA